MTTIEDSKRCTKCKIIKPLRMFHDGYSNSDGKVSWCKMCVSIYQAKYRAAKKKPKKVDIGFVNRPARMLKDSIEYKLLDYILVEQATAKPHLTNKNIIMRRQAYTKICCLRDMEINILKLFRKRELQCQEN